MNGKKSDLGGDAQYKIRQNNLDKLGFDLSKYDYPDKDKLLRNCVAPEIGKAIFDSAYGIYQANNVKQVGLFDAQTQLYCVQHPNKRTFYGNKIM